MQTNTKSTTVNCPLIIAHRGASGYAPENTLAAFKLALDMHANAIELDVHLCASGELVVIHDDTIDRTTRETGAVNQTKRKQTNTKHVTSCNKIAQLNYQTLKTLDAGNGEHIPLLSEVFDLVNNRIPIIIELKAVETAQPVAELIQQYIETQNWSPENFIVTSFDLPDLIEFQKYQPQYGPGIKKCDGQIQIGLNCDTQTNYFELTQKLHAHYLVLNHELISHELVSQTHTHNLKLYAYTVNSKARAKELAQLGIDGIITNYPDILKLT